MASQSLGRQERRDRRQRKGRLLVYLFISAPRLFSPGKNSCQVYLQSSGWGSWESQLAVRARRPPFHRCALLPSAPRWTFGPALGRARMRRTQEKYVLEKICASRSGLKSLFLVSSACHSNAIRIMYLLPFTSSRVNVHLLKHPVFWSNTSATVLNQICCLPSFYNMFMFWLLQLRKDESGHL